jgi:hypothetical protein
MGSDWSWKERLEYIGLSLAWPFYFIPLVIFLIFKEKSVSGDGELGFAMLAAWPIVAIMICYEDVKRALDEKSK